MFKKKSESNVEVIEPTKEKNEKKNKLLQITEETLEKIKYAFTYEKIIKSTPEKRKVVVDKFKAILLVATAAGITLAVQNFGAMDKVPDFLTDAVDASPESIKEGVGIILALLGVVGTGMRNIYNSEKEKQLG